MKNSRVKATYDSEVDGEWTIGPNEWTSEWVNGPISEDVDCGGE